MHGAESVVVRRLNDAWRIAWFDAAVLMPMVFCIMVGFLVGQKVLFSVIGGFLSFQMQRLKAARHPSFLSHFWRWMLPASTQISRFLSIPASENQIRLG
jgi:type IV conjugative transfer system protein TraL